MRLTVIWQVEVVTEKITNFNMNKKIKELWEQSAQRDDIMDEKRYEHFAELLIRECAKPVNHLFKQGGGTWGEVILKHFDVKIGK